MVLDRLIMMEKRYEEINNLLMDPQVVCDVKKLTDLSKQQKSIEKAVLMFREYKKCLAEIDDLKEMVKETDPDIREMAQMELEENKAKALKFEEDLTVLLLPKDPNDDKNVIVEIRGAAGGDEANIFAGDLYRMYIRYAESKGWKVEVVNAEECAAGGFSQIEFTVSGDAVYSYLKYESGAHRVQRVPVTESAGRIQTSTATVLVMPEAEEIDFSIDEKDLRMDTFCASGPGGQGVNTTYSAVRLTYIPTGDFVACQIHRSQHENKATALKLLTAKIYDRMCQEKAEKEGTIRQSLIGRGDRSEKIRTYNYPQNRVTDHRINFSIQRLDAIIEGKVDLVIDQLIAYDQKKKLSGEEEE